jgi:formamidopyrimidine-DNA glycosylase
MLVCPIAHRPTRPPTNLYLTRRFGRLRLVQGDPAKCDAFAKLGFDPLTEMPSLEDFEARLMKRKRSALKAVLLDQVRGVPSRGQIRSGG